MECWSKKQIGTLGVMAAFGGGLGFAVLPRLSDFFGRKKIVIFSSLITFIFMVLAVFFSSIPLLRAALFCGSFLLAGRVVIGFVYMQDFMRERGIANATAIAFFIDGLVLAASSAYF